MTNSFEIGINQGFINLESSDRTVNFNGSVVSKPEIRALHFSVSIGLEVLGMPMMTAFLKL